MRESVSLSPWPPDLAKVCCQGQKGDGDQCQQMCLQTREDTVLNSGCDLMGELWGGLSQKGLTFFIQKSRRVSVHPVPGSSPVSFSLRGPYIMPVSASLAVIKFVALIWCIPVFCK